VRKYYSLTDAGNETSGVLAKEFKDFSETMNQLLNNFLLNPSYHG